MENIIHENNSEKRAPVPLGWDGLFKKVFGNEDKPQNVEMLLSLVLNIPYEELKDKTQILNNDKILSNYDDKKQSQDIVLKVFLRDEESFVNLEANIHGFDQEVINRNLSYITYIFSKQLRKKVPYNLMTPVIQINFTKHTISEKTTDPNRIVDTYLLTNQHSEILTQKLQIIDIYIENCYDLWYNDGMKKFTSYEQNIIRLGALHCITNKDEFRKCIGEIKMNDDIRKSIQDDFDEYQSDKDLVYTYDREEHLERLRQGYEITHNKRMKKLDALSEKLDLKANELDTKANELNTKANELDTKANELDIMSDQLSNREKILKAKQEDFAKQLLKLGTDINEISELTFLPVDYIKNLN